MKPVRSLTPFWRSWIQVTNRQSLVSRLPPSTVSREFSYFTAESRNRLRKTITQAEFARKRWNSNTVPSAQGKDQIATDHASTRTSGLARDNSTAESQSETLKRDEPAYEITFTCKPCQTRSKHRISKQGYHKGTILITCPDCKNRHLICDHLNIFRDKSTTIEDILKEKGEMIKHGTLGAEGDIELWDDGTTTDRSDTRQEAEAESTAKTASRIESPMP